MPGLLAGTGCMRAEDKQLLHTYYMRLAKPLWRGRWTAHVAIVNPETSHCLFGAFWKRWRAISTGQGAEQSWPPSLWNPGKAFLHWGHGQLNPIPAAICPTRAAKKPHVFLSNCEQGLLWRKAGCSHWWERHVLSTCNREPRQSSSITHRARRNCEFCLPPHRATRQSHAPARILFKHR